MLAAAVDAAIRRGALDPRSEIADCRLDYGEPFSPEQVEQHLSRRRHGKSAAHKDVVAGESHAEGEPPAQPDDANPLARAIFHQDVIPSAQPENVELAQRLRNFKGIADDGSYRLPAALKLMHEAADALSRPAASSQPKNGELESDAFLDDLEEQLEHESITLNEAFRLCEMERRMLSRPAAAAQEREALIEQCARVCERRAEQRFDEHGIRESDTNATYYKASVEEECTWKDEDDADCAAAIRALAAPSARRGDG
jgi:hypothetical protein